MRGFRQMAPQRPPFNTYQQPNSAMRQAQPPQQGMVYNQYTQGQLQTAVGPASAGSVAQVQVTSPGPMLHASSPASMCYMSPSPQEPGGSQGPPSQQLLMSGVPSPALNTPVNPSMLGHEASPAPQTAEEEALYLERWKRLQKYIEPLKRMIKKIDKEEDRKKELVKMTNLLHILSDSSKRLKIGALGKCEQVLEKLEFHSGNTPEPATPGDSQYTLVQPLLDVINQAPFQEQVAHAVVQSFSCGVLPQEGQHTFTHRLRVSTPAREKKPGELSNVLQGEIARLHPRFKVTMDPIYSRTSTAKHLLCALDDDELPNVPTISVVVSEQYPQDNPYCCVIDEEYAATEFLQKLLRNLKAHLQLMPERYALTALLNTWELSVRKTCDLYLPEP